MGQILVGVLVAVKLSLSIITPHGVDFEGQADPVVIPTDLGEIEVSPGHRRMIFIIAPGKLILKNSGSGDTYAVDQGSVHLGRSNTNDFVNQEAQGLDGAYRESRPRPGPFTTIVTSFNPCDVATRPASWTRT
jgi:hypothetical protein